MEHRFLRCHLNGADLYQSQIVRAENRPFNNSIAIRNGADLYQTLSVPLPQRDDQISQMHLLDLDQTLTMTGFQ